MLEIRGHFDGTQILLDEPCELKPNTKVIVRVITEEEDVDWTALGKKNFAKAYSDDEPEYLLEDIKTLNPEYEGN
ncbi:MAG: hypothetical protein ACR2MD_09530 [Aridibacter sp.]